MITVNSKLGANPPWADLLISGLPTGTTNIRVSKIIDGREGDEVRGSSRAVVTGSTARVIDYDIPLGRSVVWQVRALSSTGGVLETVTTTSPVLVPAGADYMAWLSDPLNPTKALQVCLLRGSDDDRVLVANNSVARSSSNRLPLGVSSSVRQAPEFQLYIEASLPDIDAIEELLSPATPLLLRPSKRFRHRTGLVNIMVTDAVVDRQLYTVGKDWEILRLKCVEVRQPVVTAGTGFRVWDDVDKEIAGSWNQLDSLYAGKSWYVLDRGL